MLTARGILARFPGTSRALWALAFLVALAMGSGLWIVFVSAQAEVTVGLDGFALSCPLTVNEGDSETCVLTNTNNVRKAWPAVGLLHISTDSDRALVRGEPIDVRWGARSPAAALDNEVWWIGADLVAYSRFDWTGQATPSEARNVPLSIIQDDDYEAAERFYISLAPNHGKAVGPLYTNRQAITIAQSDAKSGDADLSSLKVAGNSWDVVRNFSANQGSYSATVHYQVTEVIVTAAAAHKRASIVVDGVPVESGAESQGVPLTAGATTSVVTTVTAENGAAKTYTVSVTRQARPQTVSVTADGFELECPSTTSEGAVLSCSLTRTGSGSKGWPVVAIIHSSADPDRALIAEDSLIVGGDPRFSRDLKFASDLSPEAVNHNYGYGELFSGGSRSIYTIYGYEKFDWTGSAANRAERTVKIQIAGDELSEPDEVFYVALAPTGYTGLSQLADNKAPVVIGE